MYSFQLFPVKFLKQTENSYFMGNTCTSGGCYNDDNKTVFQHSSDNENEINEFHNKPIQEITPQDKNTMFRHLVPIMPKIKQHEKAPFIVASEKQTMKDCFSEYEPPDEAPQNIHIEYYEDVCIKTNDFDESQKPDVLRSSPYITDSEKNVKKKQVKIIKTQEKKGRGRSLINKTFKVKLYYKTGNLCFDGKMLINDSEEDIIFGSIYHRNGQLFYTGNFYEGSPSDFECTLYYETGEIRYQGPIEEGKVPKPFSCLSKYQIHVGTFSVKSFLEKEDSWKVPNTENNVEFEMDNEIFLYLGPLIDGMREGHGSLLYSKSKISRYKGVWKNNFPDNKDGRIYGKKGALEFHGKIETGKYVEGSLYHKNGNLKYKGNFVKGEPSGKDIVIYNDEKVVKFVGEMKAGNYVYGKTYNNQGKLIYQGYFKDNKPHGEFVKLFYSSGKIRFEGTMKYGLRIYGRQFSEEGIKTYEGFFENEKPHGDNVKLYSDKGVLIYQGSMKEGVKYGFGISYTDQGKIEAKGFWNGDELNLKKYFGIKYHENGQVNAMGLSLEDKFDPDLPSHKQGTIWFKYNGQESQFTNRKLNVFNEKLSKDFMRHRFMLEMSNRENLNSNTDRSELELLDLRSRTITSNYDIITTRLNNLNSDRERKRGFSFEQEGDTDRVVERSIILGR